jgi:hypothetical protein
MKLFNVLLFTVFIFCMSCNVKDKKFDPETWKKDCMSLSPRDAIKARSVIFATLAKKDNNIKNMTYGEIIDVYDDSYNSENVEEVEEENKSPIEIDSIQTGMYKKYEYSEVYLPTVLIRFKNTSDKNFEESIQAQVVFVHNGEELGNTTEYLHSSFDPPLLAGITKTISIKSPVGFTFGKEFSDIKIDAHIYFNKQEWTTVEISGNDILYYDYITEKNDL